MPKKQITTFGNRFRFLRNNVLHLTQSKISEELETTQANISQIEKGECMPTGNFLQKIAEKFPDVDFNWLIYNEGEPMRSETIQKATIKAQQKIEKKFNAKLERLRNDNRKLIELATKKNK